MTLRRPTSGPGFTIGWRITFLAAAAAKATIVAVLLYFAVPHIHTTAEHRARCARRRGCPGFCGFYRRALLMVGHLDQICWIPSPSTGLISSSRRTRFPVARTAWWEGRAST
jgi:hypothetical protein